MNLGLRQSNMFVGVIKLLFLVTVTFMIIIHVFITSGKEIIEQNWPKYRCNPLVIPFAGEFGKNTMENTAKCTNLGFKSFFRILMEPYHFMSQSCLNSMSNINGGLNVLQFAMAPMRIFISTVTKLFYSKLTSFVTVIMYYFTRIRDILRRMSSTFHLNLHSALAVKRSLKQIWNGPIGTSARGLSNFAHAMEEIFTLGFEGSCCLTGDVLIRYQPLDTTTVDSKEIRNLEIGDYVFSDNENTTRVTGILIANSHQPELFRYGDVTCTGTHQILHEGRFQQASVVGESIGFEKKVIPVYCPLTKNHQFLSKKGICLLDYDEGEDESTDQRQFTTMLQMLLCPTEKDRKKREHIKELCASVFYHTNNSFWKVIGKSNTGISCHLPISHSEPNKSLDKIELDQQIGVSRVQAKIKFECSDDFVYRHQTGLYATGRQMIEIPLKDWNSTYGEYLKYLPIGMAFHLEMLPNWSKVSLPRSSLLFYQIWIGQGKFEISTGDENLTFLDMMDSINSSQINYIYQS